MEHAVEHFNYSETYLQKNKCKVLREINSYVQRASATGSELGNDIVFLNHAPFTTYDEAVEYLEKKASGVFYPQLAVRYYEVSKGTKSLKSVRTMQEKVRLLNKRYWDLAQKPHFKDFKSQFIGCKKCGSRLSVQHLGSSNICPLCRTDLRPPTVLNELAKLEHQIQDLQLKLQQTEKDTQLKKIQQGKAEVRWLIRIEFHI